MKEVRPLTEQEKRHLNTVKLFLERGTPEQIEAAKIADELPPDEARAIIACYHQALKNPKAWLLANTILRWWWIIRHPWKHIVDILRRRKL